MTQLATNGNGVHLPAHPVPTIPETNHQETTYSVRDGNPRSAHSQSHYAGVSVKMSHSNGFDSLPQPWKRGVSKKAQREQFKVLWSQYLRASFRSPEHVSVAFDVTFQSAWNWWNGLVCPLGDEVNTAHRLHPEIARDYLNRAA